MTTNGRNTATSENSGSGARVLLLDSLPLESSATLEKAPVAFRTWGRLNDAGDNAVVVCHALTGSSDVTDWWPGIVGPGLALDTSRYFVVCMNTLGSPYGSASPLTPNPHSGLPYGSRFPTVTIRDTVNAHRVVLNRLGVRGVVAAIGASMGGMQALEWAFHEDLVQSIVPIAVGGRHSAWCIGWSEAQRQAVFADPNWRNGDYESQHPPSAGLAAARMMAMISYRSHQEFDGRFGRQRMSEKTDSGEQLFAAESYLRHQGEKLVARFDANCYVHLTRQMDTHDVSRGRGEYRSVLQSIRIPALVIGITTDILYPIVEQRELTDCIPAASLYVLQSPYGHDSFLIETEQMSQLMSGWIQGHAPPSNAAITHYSAVARDASTLRWRSLLREGEQHV